MLFSYNWLQSFFTRATAKSEEETSVSSTQRKLPKPEKLAELLTMHSFEVEEVKRVGGDFVLNIDVLPNRAPDCFSHLGIAREIAVTTNSKLNEMSTSAKASAGKTKDFISLEVKDKTACPRYTAKVITDVKVGVSPKWLKDRLKVCGLNSINNIVDIANYVMLETGQPLHAFDGEKLKGKKIVVRFAKNRERIITLDEQKFDLNPDILVIADEKSPIAIAGIKGGKLPEIDKKTKVVVLESANFNPQVIRRGSKKLNLKTDASLRFEHGIDPNLTEFAINRAAYLIQKIAGGKIARGLADIYPKKVFSKRIKLDLNYIENLLGVKIPINEIKNILKRLGFRIIEVKPRYIGVEVPTFRLDISIPEDLIEEIGRIAGYDKIKATFPVSSLIPPKRNLNIFWEDVAKNILKEAGFTEVYNYSFFGEKEAKLFGYLKRKELGEEDKSSSSPKRASAKLKKENEVLFASANARVIEVENPQSSEQKYLRASLIPNLLKNLQKNQKYFNKIRIFELGKIFKNQKIPEEKRMLAGLVVGDIFYQLKGVIDILLNKLGISNIWYDDYQPTPEESKLFIWHPKKCAEIKIDGEEIGFLGEISPKILDGLNIQGKIILFDIDFEKLSKFVSEEHEYRPISRFPAAVRDIAVLVPRRVKVVEVLNKINRVGGSLIRDIDLFDLYEGEELPEGKKNLAFHIVYQREDRTLSAKEIDGVQSKIIKTLEKNLGWQVRGR